MYCVELTVPFTHFASKKKKKKLLFFWDELEEHRNGSAKYSHSEKCHTYS